MSRLCLLFASGLLIAALVLAPAVQPAFSAPRRSFGPEQLPADVRVHYHSAVESCHEIRGKLRVANSPPYVRRADFNGDGRLDYLLDSHALDCSAFHSLFCGTLGCGLELMLSQAHGRFLAAGPSLTVRSSRVVFTRAGTRLYVRSRSGPERVWGWNGKALVLLR